MKNNISLEKLVTDLKNKSQEDILIKDLERKMKSYFVNNHDTAIMSDRLAKIFETIKNNLISKVEDSKSKFIESCQNETGQDIKVLSELSLAEFLRLSNDQDIILDPKKNILWKISKEDHGTKGKKDIVTIAVPFEDQKVYPKYKKANFEIWDGKLEENVHYKDLVNITKDWT